MQHVALPNQKRTGILALDVLHSTFSLRFPEPPRYR
jgi:hypothetical protein